MTTIPDHYAALGIDPTADPEVITAAYRALAKKFHPDTGSAGGTASAERFDEIQKAYEVLRNPETRHAYDLELLEATERELQAHIAAKRRVVVREAERASAPPPDLGDIRPEPANPPGSAAAGKRRARSLFPVLVPLLLVAMVGGGAAVMLLPKGPDAPPLPGSAQQEVASATPAAPEAAAQPEAVAQPAEKADPQPVQPPAQQPGAAAAPNASAEAEKPVFGSTAADGGAQLASADPTPEPAAAPAPADAAAKPAFGSLGSEPAAAPPPEAAPQDPEAPAAAVPPLPKAKPVQKQAQPRQPAQQQPRARLAYQDPPEYFPEPDGFPPPPPGMEPPGFAPEYPGYDVEDMPPPGYRPPGRGPYRLVIFERQPGRQATAWSAGVVFKSMGKCTKQGVKAVLRRTAGMDPYDGGTRVWYECQQLSQR